MTLVNNLIIIQLTSKSKMVCCKLKTKLHSVS